MFNAKNPQNYPHRHGCLLCFRKTEEPMGSFLYRSITLDTNKGIGHTFAMAYDIKHSFQNLAQYNERANQEMYEILSKLTGRARKREVGSWFGSIHGILVLFHF